MPTVPLIQYDEASAEVRAVYDEIMAARGTDWVNDFWKALANHPATLRRTWDALRQVMAPGALDPLVKEMLYVAVSMTNGCEYCIHSHTAAARKAGMTPEMYGELVAVVGMANQTNALVTGLRVPPDEVFTRPGPPGAGALAAPAKVKKPKATTEKKPGKKRGGKKSS